MAHVTISSGYPKVNVNGSSRELYYILSGIDDGDYLDVPMRTVEHASFTTDVDTEGVAIESIAVQGYGSRITLDCASSVTTVYARVTGK